MNQVHDNCWNKNIMREDLIQRKPPIPHAVRELMNAKTTAQDAISELLELLPQNDVRCGMVRVLGEWVTYSHHLRGGGFSLDNGNPLSINELSPCVPRFVILIYLYGKQ